MSTGFNSTTSTGRRLGSSNDTKAVLQASQRREREDNPVDYKNQFEGLCRALDASRLSFRSVRWGCLQHLRQSLLNTPDYFICPRCSTT